MLTLLPLVALMLLALPARLEARQAPRWALGAVGFSGGLEPFGFTYVGVSASRVILQGGWWRARAEWTLLSKTSAEDFTCPAVPGIICDLRSIGPMGSVTGVVTFGRLAPNLQQRRYVIAGAGMLFTRWENGSVILASTNTGEIDRYFRGAGPASALLEGGVGTQFGGGDVVPRIELRLQHFEARYRRGNAVVAGLSLVW